MSARGALNPKSIYEVMDSIPVRDGVSVIQKETTMLKAYSKKYKERNLLIGNTSFSFDREGYCSIEDVGNNRVDYELLLKLNHVTAVVDEEEELDAGEAREEDVREGIDAELLAEELEEEEPEEELLDEEEEEPEEEEDESDVDSED